MLSKCQISIAHKIKQLYYKIIAFAIENSYCNFYYTNVYNEDYVSNIGGIAQTFDIASFPQDNLFKRRSQFMHECLIWTLQVYKSPPNEVCVVAFGDAEQRCLLFGAS